MNQVINLRANNWRTVPIGPGVYWWYFPEECLERFRILEFCQVKALNLRWADNGKVCLYHGMASSLAQRTKWHAAQSLRIGALKSGFLSTFRYTLLALNGFDFLTGSAEIDHFMDGLDVAWQSAPSVADAEAIESTELAGVYHYPLNIQNNRRPEMANFTRHLKGTRRDYKRRYI
jgi:hypothetical protein